MCSPLLLLYLTLSLPPLPRLSTSSLLIHCVELIPRVSLGVQVYNILGGPRLHGAARVDAMGDRGEKKMMMKKKKEEEEEKEIEKVWYETLNDGCMAPYVG